MHIRTETSVSVQRYNKSQETLRTGTIQVMSDRNLDWEVLVSINDTKEITIWITDPSSNCVDVPLTSGLLDHIVRIKSKREK